MACLRIQSRTSAGPAGPRVDDLAGAEAELHIDERVVAVKAASRGLAEQPQVFMRHAWIGKVAEADCAAAPALLLRPTNETSGAGVALEPWQTRCRVLGVFRSELGQQMRSGMRDSFKKVDMNYSSGDNELKHLLD